MFLDDQESIKKLISNDPSLHSLKYAAKANSRISDYHLIPTRFSKPKSFMGILPNRDVKQGINYTPDVRRSFDTVEGGELHVKSRLSLK